MSMQNTVLDLQGIMEAIKNNSMKMYEVISDLENLMINGNYYVDDSYIIPNQESIELEEYLETYIESIHVKICMILEYYKLDKLYNQYINDFNKHSKTNLKYYHEVGVMDSPIWGVMSQYVNTLSYIHDGSDVDKSINIFNNNYVKADLDNRSDINVSQTLNNSNFFESTGKILEKLKVLEFLNESDNKNYKIYIEELENSIINKDTDKINKYLIKVREFLANISMDYVKDEIKKQIPFIIKMVYDLINNTPR
jgi:hypothetical protein